VVVLIENVEKEGIVTSEEIECALCKLIAALCLYVRLG
jgi:hypothetical protein